MDAARLSCSPRIFLHKERVNWVGGGLQAGGRAKLGDDVWAGKIWEVWIFLMGHGNAPV